MSALWDAIIRRFKHSLNFVCPFFNTDYDYGPTPEPSERDPISEDLEIKKEKHVRKTDKDGKDQFVVQIDDDEAGFTSKSTESDSQCESVEVHNSEELKRIEIRKSEFLPAKPYEPTVSPVPQFRFTDDQLDGYTEPVDDTPIDTPYNVPRAITPTSPSPRGWTTSRSPEIVPDSASAYSRQSKKSKKSIFNKKKSKKGDGDNVSMISFKSIKSRISLSSQGSKMDKKDRKRVKEEKKERKAVDKQQLNLGTLGNHHLENMYPWMNEMEELEDDYPDVIEEIRIREAMDIQDRIQREAREEEPSIIDPVEPSIMDLASQMVPISQMTEPTFHNPNQNKYGVPEGTLRRPLVARVIDVGDVSENGPLRLRQLSSDPETDGVIRKSRAMNSEKSVSITMKTPGIAPGLKRKPTQPVVFKKKDIFASNLSENMDDKDSIPEKFINKDISENIDYSKINQFEIEDYSKVTPETPPEPPKIPFRPRPVSPMGPEYAMPPRPKREDLKPLIIGETDSTLEKNARKIQAVSPEDRPERYNRKPSPEPKMMKPYWEKAVRGSRSPEPKIRDVVEKAQKRAKTPLKTPEESDPLHRDNLPALPPRDPAPKLKHVVQRVQANRTPEPKLKEVVEKARAHDRKPAKVVIEKVEVERIVVNQKLADNRMEYFKLDPKAKEILNAEPDEQEVVLKRGGESGDYIPGQNRVRRDSIEVDGERMRHRRKGVESERDDKRRRRSSSPDRRPREGRRAQSTRDRPERKPRSSRDEEGRKIFSSDEVKEKRRKNPIVKLDIPDNDPDAIYADLGLSAKPTKEQKLHRRRRRREGESESDYAKSEAEVERRRSRQPREDGKSRRRSSSVVQSDGEGRRRRRRMSDGEDGFKSPEQSERRKRIERLKSPEPNRERRSSRRTPEVPAPASPGADTELTAIELDGRKARRDGKDRDRSRRSEGRSRRGEERRSSREPGDRRSRRDGEEGRPRSSRESGERRSRGEGEERRTKSSRDGAERRPRKEGVERRSRRSEGERRPRRSSRTPESSIPPTPEPVTVEQADEQIRLEVQEKRRLELVRKKMDLDFQSVDTKRSVFVMDEVKSAGSSKRDLWEKKQKKRPSSRPRVHTRPSKMQEERSTLREIDEVSIEKEKSSAGSTIHSGDVVPLPKKIEEDSDSADSTLKDIGDIPSEWNASQRTRAKSIKSGKSVKSNGSGDSRITHRSQISLVRGRKDLEVDRRSPAKVLKVKKDVKKGKKKK